MFPLLTVDYHEGLHRHRQIINVRTEDRATTTSANCNVLVYYTAR